MTSEPIELPPLTRALLCELARDPLADTRTVAGRLGIPPRQADELTKELTALGLLGPVMPRVDLFRLGYGEFGIFAKRHSTERGPVNINEIDPHALNGIAVIAEATGTYDLVLIVNAGSVDEARRLVDRFLAESNISLEYQTIAVRSAVHHMHDRFLGVPSGATPQRYSMQEPAGVEVLSPEEHSILSALTTAEERSREEVAASLSLTTASLNQQIKRLAARGIIHAFVRHVAVERLGIFSYRLLVSTSSCSPLVQRLLLNLATMERRVGLLIETLGAWSYELEAHLPAATSVATFEDLIRSTLGANLRSIDSVRITRYVRVCPYPFHEDTQPITSSYRTHSSTGGQEHTRLRSP